MLILLDIELATHNWNEMIQVSSLGAWWFIRKFFLAAIKVDIFLHTFATSISADYHSSALDISECALLPFFLMQYATGVDPG